MIRIIREDDEPKARADGALRADASRRPITSSTRGCARCAGSRRWQLRKEQAELIEEKGQIEALLASDKKQWQVIAHEIRDTKKKYGPETKIGKRRTSFEAPPNVVVDVAESLIEREPVTILLSQKGWIRALKGHVADLSTATFKGDDSLQTSFFAETTSKILVLASDGKVVHARRLQTAGRALAGRADAADGRHRRSGRDRRGLALCAGREDADRGHRRARLRRRRRTR